MTRPAENSPTAVSLAGRTSRGFAWMLVQTLGSKFFGIVGQIFLARLLSPRDFGSVAMTYNAVAIPAMLRQTGIPQILVQKQGSFDRWANAAFWMELALGVASGLCMVAFIPVAVLLFHTREIIGPMMLVASVAPINALSTVPMASLSLNLRFREIAGLGLAYNVLAMALSVALAFLGCGVYSFVIPLPIVAGLRAMAAWWLSPPRIRLDLQLHRWRAMVVDSSLLLAYGVCWTLSGMSYLTFLGMFAAPAVVGQVFFAGNLTSQVAQLLSTNLAAVLFPVLSTLKGDRARQASAFFRAVRALLLVGVPICLGAAVLARPLIFFFFGDKWQLAAVAMPVYAVGAIFALANAPAQNLLQAQGRFRTLLIWSAAATGVYLPCLFLATKFGGAVPGLLVVVANYTVVTIGLMALGSRGGRSAWMQVARAFAPPILMAGAALAPAAVLEVFSAWARANHLAMILFAVVTAVPIYIALAWRFCPADAEELLGHAGPLGRRLRRFVPPPRIP